MRHDGYHKTTFTVTLDCGRGILYYSRTRTGHVDIHQRH